MNLVCSFDGTQRASDTFTTEEMQLIEVLRSTVKHAGLQEDSGARQRHGSITLR